MPQFPVHTIESAPALSQPGLRSLQEAFGFIPNVAGVIAGSPVLMNGFTSVFQNVHTSSLSEAQIQVLLLTNAVTNACHWATAFHTFLARQHGVSGGDVLAIRERRSPHDQGFAALSTLAKGLIERRGHLTNAERQAFFDAGFVESQMLEVILVVAASTITNYSASVAQPPLEEAFQASA